MTKPADPTVCLVHPPDQDSTPWISCFQNSGCEVQAFHNTELALAALAEHAFDALVVRVEFAHTCWPGFIETVISQHPHLPVLAFADHADTLEVVEAFRVGVSDFLLPVHRSAVEISKRVAQSIEQAQRKHEHIVALENQTEALKLSLTLKGIGGKLAKMGSWAIDMASGGAVYWSPQTFKLLEVDDEHAFDFLSGLDRYQGIHKEVVSNAVKRCIEHGENFDVSVEMSTQKGTTMWARIIGEAVRDARGKTIRIQGCIQDLTERRNNEQALQESLLMFQTLTKVTSDCIWDWNVETGDIWWSEGIETMFGHRRADIEPGFAFCTLNIHPDDRDTVHGGLIDAVDSGKNTWQAKYRFAHADGHWCEVIDRAHVIRDGNGKALRVLGGITDVSLLMQGQRNSHAQLERMNLLHQITRGIGNRQDIESIYEIVTCNLEEKLPADFCLMSTYDKANNLLCVRSVGKQSKALASKLKLDVNSKVPGKGLFIEKALKGEYVYNPDLSEERGPIGALMQVVGGLHSVIINPLMNNSEVLALAVVARFDKHAFSENERAFVGQLSEHVTIALIQASLLQELQHAYNDLKQTQDLVLQQERLRALAEMASGLAHDINNAISPAALYTENLLLRETNLSPKGMEQLKVVRTAITDVANTVERIGRFSKLVPDEAEAPSGDLNKACTEAIELTRVRWQNMANKQGISIQLKPELQEGLPCLGMSETEMREIVTNLIFNAIDAMPKGGQIGVKTRWCKNTNEALLEISDNGIGMTEQLKAHCFEPFFTTKGERGSGLGLAMVYGITQRAKGRMEIQSAVGRGTSILIWLPTPSAPHPQSTPVIGLEAAAPQTLRLLLVDDEERVLQSMYDVLSSLGHEVATAPDGEQALNLFSQHITQNQPFDAVVTDLGMPQMDGRQLAQKIKQIDPDTPVIMLTGWGKQILNEGESIPSVDKVLSKPAKLGELSETLRAVCQVRKRA